jgi:osmoprotectant transport system substrate-binding protein
VATAALLVASCQEDAPTPSTDAEGSVVVASFDFAEGRLLAEIYAQALEDEGIEVRRELDLGPRELVLPALRQGLIDVVPEYAGSALEATSPGRVLDRSDLASVTVALQAAVRPWGVSVLPPAAASSQNVIAVSAELAEERALTAVSDLTGLAPSLTIGGPPECARRPLCLPGLARVYGLRFERFVPLAGEELVRRALEDGVVDVGVLFSTDAALAGSELTVLDDDRELQRPDNVLPLVREDALGRPQVRTALDEVSVALTTTSLRFLNWRVAHSGAGGAAEARGWLVRQGLVDR